MSGARRHPIVSRPVAALRRSRRVHGTLAAAFAAATLVACSSTETFTASTAASHTAAAPPTVAGRIPEPGTAERPVAAAPARRTSAGHAGRGPAAAVPALPRRTLPGPAVAVPPFPTTAPQPAAQPNLSRLAQELSQWLAMQRTSGQLRWFQQHHGEAEPR